MKNRCRVFAAAAISSHTVSNSASSVIRPRSTPALAHAKDRQSRYSTFGTRESNFIVARTNALCIPMTVAQKSSKFREFKYLENPVALLM
jgi:hypothetical protein